MTGSLKKGQRRVSLACLIFFVSLFHIALSDGFARTVRARSASIIRARSAVVVDAATEKVLYSKNPDRPLFPASTTKLMTAILAVENKPLSEIVMISNNASHAPPTKAGLREGSRVTVEGLLYAALVKSANDAAIALAEAVAGSEEDFVKQMNQKAASIGALNTRFINSTGLSGPGQYTTAVDLSRIMRYTLQYPKLREILRTLVARVETEEGKILSLRNTDTLLWSDDGIIGGKTGYTANAGHCFVCAAENGTKTVIVAVLGSSSRRALWKETERLIARGLQAAIH